MLQSNGLSTLPWGVPRELATTFSPIASRYPALRADSTRFRVVLHGIRRSIISRSFKWFMRSKHLRISDSTSHRLCPNCVRTWFKAEWQPLFGRNPWEFVEKRGSNTADSVSWRAFCTTLSLGELIPSGLVSVELGLGIWIRRMFLNLYLPDRSSELILVTQSRPMSSSVSIETPGVIKCVAAARGGAAGSRPTLTRALSVAKRP